MLPLLCERGTYPIILGDKGYISEKLEADLLKMDNVCLFPNQKALRQGFVRSMLNSERIDGQCVSITDKFGGWTLGVRTRRHNIRQGFVRSMLNSDV